MQSRNHSTRDSFLRAQSAFPASSAAKEADMRDMLQASNGQQRLDAEDMRMHALRNLQHQTTSKPAAASPGEYRSRWWRGR